MASEGWEASTITDAVASVPKASRSIMCKTLSHKRLLGWKPFPGAQRVTSTPGKGEDEC
jgi:hypothetical protein